MKKIINLLSACLVLFAFSACSNPATPENEPKPQQSIDAPAFQLFPTTNMWTFIKLDTRNGQTWQVQYDIQDDNRMEVILNETPLVQDNKGENGRFTLYPTKNMFTFILLDQLDGRTWQMQWSIDADERFIIPINPIQDSISQ